VLRAFVVSPLLTGEGKWLGMDHILGAELWMLVTEDPTGEGRTGGLLLIATPTGKHRHWMPLQEYEGKEHLQTMALHYIGTLGLEEMTVLECTTTETYLLARDDDGQDHDDQEDDAL
jgi:hypothetical protein